MLLLYFAKLLAASKQRTMGHSKFLENLSLIPPHVGSNGREDYFDFENHYLIKTKTRRDYTQLGYKAPNTYGMIKSKENFKFKDMEVSFEFTLQDVRKSGKQAGFGFWLTEQALNRAEFYGGSRSFNGCGVIFDTEGTPYAKFIDSKNLSRKGVPISANENESFRVVFSNKDKKFSAKLYVSDKEHLLHEGPIAMPDRVFLNATSYSGSSSATLRLERIFTQSFTPSSKKAAKRGERKGRNGFIYVLGISTIAGLIYYLYQKDQKAYIMKN